MPAVTYEIGYYPSDQRLDSRFRRLSVDVIRRGLQVRHRSGYYALPPRPADAQAAADGLVVALSRPLEATGLGVTVQAEPSDKADHITLVTRIDSRGITLAQKGGQWHGALEVMVAHTTPSNELRGSVQTTIPLVMPDAVRQRFFDEGVTIRNTVRLAADARQLIVGVRDVASGAVGTVRIGAARLR